MVLGMNNLDKAKLKNEMMNAMKAQDEKKYLECFEQICELYANETLEKAKELSNVHDQEILASRGIRVLTSQEKKYYNKLIESMKSNNPRQAITDIETALPITVLDAVFDDLQTNHPLLNEINFVNTRGAIKFLISKNGDQKALWGKLCSTITKELEESFEEIDMTLMKLTAFLPVCEAMLELGVEWLDDYVRKCLYEALANGLEDAIINNLKTETGPIGMTADLTKGSASGANVTYTAKTATKLDNLNPVTLGTVLAKLAKDDAGKTRVLNKVIFIVNPVDYLTKVYPAITVMGGDGKYHQALPFPMTIIQSSAVSTNKAILGLGYRYFMGIGMGSKDGKIEYSDEFKWLEDVRTYKIKLYANGKPMDNNAFQLLDIATLKPASVHVIVDTGALPAMTTANFDESVVKSESEEELAVQQADEEKKKNSK